MAMPNLEAPMVSEFSNVAEEAATERDKAQSDFRHKAELHEEQANKYRQLAEQHAAAALIYRDLAGDRPRPEDSPFQGDIKDPRFGASQRF